MPPNRISRRCAMLLTAAAVLPGNSSPAQTASADEATDRELIAAVKAALQKAVTFMSDTVAVRGGYVYQVSLDLKKRRGEGDATATEIWVQPPGTPAVGEALLDAFAATKDPLHLQAAMNAAEALLFGQLESGGWTDRIDFDPAGKNTGRYRDGRGKAKGRNYSTLDDDKSQSAIRFLIRLDHLLKFENTRIHEAVSFALESLLKAQFANGGFPQGWQQPVETGTIVNASFPDYDWKTEGRFKNYWDFETLNDGLTGTVARTLQLAHTTYADNRYRQALAQLGDFLIRAQLPEPQPAWAQQYNHQLQPIWARRFEPPAVAGFESEDAIQTLMFIAENTGDPKYLQPIPAALAWIRRSLLSDGRLARFYELRTNRPLYFIRESYELTYDDSQLPTHYSFRANTRSEKLQKRLEQLQSGPLTPPPGRSSDLRSLRRDAAEILQELDSQGRWISDGKGRTIRDVSDRDTAGLWIESAVFSKRVSRLAEFLQAAENRR
jgi:PelA/Pel-15E family pectate lyase